MRKIKTGVIGVGNLGRHHARCYRSHAAAELVGVADIDRERGEEVARKNKCLYFSDYRELLPRVAAVSVVVPTQGHHRLALACLRAGLHVLVEKPMAANVRQAGEMIAAAKRKRLILQVGHIERFNPLIRAVRKVPGKLRYVVAERLAPFRELSLDVGVVLDLMIHDIDLVLDLAGSSVRKVDVIGVPVFTSQEDMANVRLEFVNGCVANLSASRMSRKNSRKIRLFKGESYISVDLLKNKVAAWRRESGRGRHTKVGKMKLRVEKAEPLYAELGSFLDCVRTGRPPLVDGKAGRDALALAGKIQAEIRRNLRK